VLELLLPKGKKPGRPPKWTRRQLIDDIRFRVRTGIPWRDMPAEYRHWGRAYDLFHSWQHNGTWQRIVTELQARADAKDLITWDLNVDSPVCRAHQHAAGARKRGPAEGAARRRRSRARQPRPRGLARRPDHQAAPRRRAGAKAHDHRNHRRAARGLPTVRGCPGPHQGAPAGVRQTAHCRGGCVLIRRTPPGRTAPTCADVAFAAPSRTKPTRPATEGNSAPAAAVRRSATRRTTRLGTRSSAASIASKGTVPRPRGTTSSRSATRRPCPLRGGQQLMNRSPKPTTAKKTAKKTAAKPERSA